jgi:hypothetical protein
VGNKYENQYFRQHADLFQSGESCSGLGWWLHALRDRKSSYSIAQLSLVCIAKFPSDTKMAQATAFIFCATKSERGKKDIISIFFWKHHSRY